MTQTAVADRATMVARELSLPAAAVARTLELLAELRRFLEPRI